MMRTSCCTVSQVMGCPFAEMKRAAQWPPVRFVMGTLRGGGFWRVLLGLPELVGHPLRIAAMCRHRVAFLRELDRSVRLYIAGMIEGREVDHPVTERKGDDCREWFADGIIAVIDERPIPDDPANGRCDDSHASFSFG